MATVTDTYYTPVESSVSNNCTSGGVFQVGALKANTAAGASPIVHQFEYDVAGRVVAARVATDTLWSCSTYDTRGRATSQSDSAGRTTTCAVALGSSLII